LLANIAGDGNYCWQILLELAIIASRQRFELKVARIVKFFPGNIFSIQQIPWKNHSLLLTVLMLG